MANPIFKTLKSRAHNLKPVVWLGQHGLTEPVLTEIDIALSAHELIKIKIPGDDREARKQIILDIQSKMQTELIQHVGKIATFYRKKNDVPTVKAKKAAPKRNFKKTTPRKSPSSR
ncbi:MAG: YhbY family RNA-binding protein [Gammaproteobacteria bacterium]|jgi:RNA-binding protein|nr:YhbY family RNA-binding protein [Gammaproteobacteria bacterium]